MKKSMRWITLIILLLSLSALACGLVGGGDEPAATIAPTAEVSNNNDDSSSDDTNNDNDDSNNNSEPEPTAEPEPTDEPEPTAEPEPTDEPEPTAEPEPTVALDAEAPTLDLGNASNKLGEVNSYRMDLSMTFDGVSDGETVSGGMDGVIISSNDPVASDITMVMTGFDDFGGEEVNIAVVQFDGTAHVSMTGLGCFSSAAEEMGDMTDNFNEIANPEELFDGADLDQATYVGVQTQGGYESDCYEFDENSVPADASADLAINEGLVCISKEFGHVSYIYLDGEGANDIFTDGSNANGSMILELTVSGVNEAYEFTIPAECENTGEGAYPTMADATDVNSFAGFYTYNSASSFADVVAFYQTEMPANGYTAGEELVLDGSLATLDFTDADGVTVSVTITPVDGVTQVLILGGE